MQASLAPSVKGGSGRLGATTTLAAIVMVTFAVHALSPITTSTDSAWTFHVAASILREGNIDLDEYRPLMDLDLDYRLRLIHGHIYSYYPAATPFVVSPAVWLVNLIYSASHPIDFYGYLANHAPDARTAKLEKLIASLFVSMAAALMYLVAHRFLGTQGALAITFIFAFSTCMWSTASRALWQHGPSALLLVTALYLTLSHADESRAIMLTGAVLAFAYLVRPTNSLSLAFIAMFHALNDRRRLLWYAAGGALVLLPYVGHNWLTYANLLPPYAYQLFERFGSPATFLEALAGTLFSPGRGLFVFTPVFLFAVYGAFLALSRRGFSISNVDVYLICIIFGHWIITSLFEDWGGAWSIGPRYFVDMIPYLTYLLIPVFQYGVLRAGVLRALFMASVLFSTLIQFHCSTSPYPFLWNGKPAALVNAPERKWDWGDLQFLRGFCPDDPLEGKAPACWMVPRG